MGSSAGTSWRLGCGAAFGLQASIVALFLAGSSAPTAMYALYQRAWGFSPLTITVVFGVYALAVLSTLLVAGSLSDYIGRRPVLLTGALLQTLAMSVFATAAGVPALIVARVIQGVATGAAMGAAGAGMLDLHRERGTMANAVSPLMGVATGALLSGLFVRYLPAPTHLLYWVFAAVFVTQAVGVVLMPESVSPRAGAWAALRPKLHVPPRLRRAVWVAVPAVVGVWALAGFYGSLGPALVRLLAGSASPLLGGLALAVLSASGALAVFVLRNVSARTTALHGAGALIAGLIAAQVAISERSVVMFFAATTLAGAGFGASFQGSLRSVMQLTEAHERAGTLSVLLLAAYLAMGLPAMLGGVYLAATGSVLATAQLYTAVLLVLGVMAMLGRWSQRGEGLPVSHAKSTPSF